MANFISPNLRLCNEIKTPWASERQSHMIQTMYKQRRWYAWKNVKFQLQLNNESRFRSKSLESDSSTTSFVAHNVLQPSTVRTCVRPSYIHRKTMVRPNKLKIPLPMNNENTFQSNNLESESLRANFIAYNIPRPAQDTFRQQFVHARSNNLESNSSNVGSLPHNLRRPVRDAGWRKGHASPS